MKNFICELILSCVLAAPVGKPIDEERMKMLESDPRGFMAWLREHTLSLNG